MVTKNHLRNYHNVSVLLLAFCFLVTPLLGLDDQPSSLAIQNARASQAQDAESTSTQVIAFTIDGSIHAIDSATGTPKWSLQSGRPLFSSGASESITQPAFVPALDGSGAIYMRADDGSGNIAKLPVTTYDIVSSSPLFVAGSNGGDADGDDGRASVSWMKEDTMYTGEKRTAIFAVDPSTGRLLKIMGGTQRPDTDIRDTTMALSELHDWDGCPAGLPPGTLFIGRADYHIRAMDPKTGVERWNISIGEYAPYMATGNRATKPQATPNAQFVVSDERNIHSFQSDKRVWTSALPNPLVSLFTLDQNRGALAPAVPKYNTPTSAADQNALATDSAVYIGGFKGQLYALRTPITSLPSLPSSPALPNIPGEDNSNSLVPQDNSHVHDLTNPCMPGDHTCSITGFHIIPSLPVLAPPETPYDIAIPSPPLNTNTTPSSSTLLNLPDTYKDVIGYIIAAALIVVTMIGWYLWWPSKYNPFLVHEDTYLRQAVQRRRKKKNKKPTRGTPSHHTDDANSLAESNSTPREGRPSRTPHHQEDEDEAEEGDEEGGVVSAEQQVDVENEEVIELVEEAIQEGEAEEEVVADLEDGGEEATHILEEVDAELEDNAANEGLLAHVNSLPASSRASTTATPPPPLLPPPSTVPVPSSPSPSSRSFVSNGCIRVGKLELLTELVLGYGSSGTIVFEGRLEGRRVAVKRMLRQFVDLAQHEVDLLLHADEHQHVVTYYAKEEDHEFVYLALSYCPSSLQAYIDSERTAFMKANPNNGGGPSAPLPLLSVSQLRLVKEIISGVGHLHALQIVHRDIKPQNILVDTAGRVRISDMGLGKRLARDQSSFSGRYSGSVGWQAPELLLETSTERLTKKVDIFALGCVVYYVLTQGGHPFGENKIEREVRIVKGQSDLSVLESAPEAVHLLGQMLAPSPQARPGAPQALLHPLFWSPNKKLQFLLAASDYMEFEKPSSEMVIRFESHGLEIMRGNDWTRLLDPLLIENLGKYRKYKTDSLRDMLRVVRNKVHHFRDLPDNLQKVLGPLPDGFYTHFSQRFPVLLIRTYEVVKEYCDQAEEFRMFLHE
eukprot:TRINITY_DN4131_c0_g1_i9.p1 TRINITY_DN4131_c0_g1~~TRINITY_DN4131_c0_g1_i9.p1  ORF type:complete len:1068 (-),score=237.66 TRINITY_DN4131_c0_g1_i9:40-3243(-)